MYDHDFTYFKFAKQTFLEENHGILQKLLIVTKKIPLIATEILILLNLQCLSVACGLFYEEYGNCDLILCLVITTDCKMFSLTL